MICIRRRSARRSSCARPVTSTPSKGRSPSPRGRAGGSPARSSSCRSPTRPRARPSPHARPERDAGHGVHEPLRPPQDRPAEAAWDAVADDEVLDLEQRPAVRVESLTRRPPTELAKWQALTWPSPDRSAAPDAPTCTRDGREVAARRERTAVELLVEPRRHARDREHVVARRRGRASRPRASACRDAASRGRARPSAPARRSGPRTSRRRACTSGRRSAGRA